MIIVRGWTKKDRAHFDDVGGFMAAGGRVRVPVSFEVLFVPPDPAGEGSGDPHYERYARGAGFAELGYSDSLDGKKFPLSLEAKPGLPIVCRHRTP